MTKKKKKRSTAASNGSRTSKASAPKTAKKSTPARAAVSGSGGSKPKKTPNNTPPKVTAAPIGTAASEKQPEKKVNAWRDEPGTDQPLRVGRGVRTRDDQQYGQKGKTIHPEQDPDELYRRGIVAKIGHKEKLAVMPVKRSDSPKGKPIPNDKTNRKYLVEVWTLNADGQPIRLKEGKYELAPGAEDVTEEQARAMLEEALTIQENKRRIDEFDAASKRKRDKRNKKKDEGK